MFTGKASSMEKTALSGPGMRPGWRGTGGNAIAAMLAVMFLAGCSAMSEMSADERAQANLCEWARSRDPYYPSDCTTRPPTCRNCGVLFPQAAATQQR